MACRFHEYTRMYKAEHVRIQQGVDPVTKTLGITTTANQDPLLAMTPLLGIDMWEHAFYLQHQNRKPDYLAVRLDLKDLHCH